MKIHDLLNEDESLNEASLRKTLAAGALAVAASLSPFNKSKTENPAQTITHTASDFSKTSFGSANDSSHQRKRYIDLIVDKYDVSPKLAEKIVKSAEKHARESFPQVKDILALISVESKFNPKATSQLRDDPAVGLTQIRPGVFKIRDVNGFKNDIDKQIGMAASLLDDYYKKYGSKQVALDAYNLGIGSVAQGKSNPHYRKKFKTELNAFERA